MDAANHLPKRADVISPVGSALVCDPVTVRRSARVAGIENVGVGTVNAIGIVIPKASVVETLTVKKTARGSPIENALASGTARDPVVIDLSRPTQMPSPLENMPAAPSATAPMTAKLKTV